MSRWVIAGGAGAGGAALAPPAGGGDGPAARIVKYIPGEVVSTFTLIETALVNFKLDPQQAKLLAVGLLVFFLIVTVIYVARNAAASSRAYHLIVSPIAFVAWAYPVAAGVLADYYLAAVAFVLQAIALGLSLLLVPKQNPAQ